MSLNYPSYPPKRFSLEMERLVFSMKGQILNYVAAAAGESLTTASRTPIAVGSPLKLHITPMGNLFLSLRSEDFERLAEIIFLEILTEGEVRRWPGGPLVSWVSLPEIVLPFVPSEIRSVHIVTSLGPNEPEVDDGLLIGLANDCRLLFCASPTPLVFDIVTNQADVQRFVEDRRLRPPLEQ